MNTQPSLIALSLGIAASLTGFLAPADASTYISQNGNTRLSIYGEAPNQSNLHLSVEYRTKAEGQSRSGWSTSLQSQGAGAGHSFFKGTFRDWVPDGSKECTGNIAISRTNPGISNVLTANVHWTVTGGQNCPSVGQVYTVSLTEDLPKPDANGDFNPQNAAGSLSFGSQGNVWEKWRVVSADGSLNCRAYPTGFIAKTYTTGQTFGGSSDRAGQAFFDSQHRNQGSASNRPETGELWLRTTDGCFVRANRRFIQPVSLPI